MASDWQVWKLGELCLINPEKRHSDWPHSTMRYIDISSIGTGVFNEPPKVIDVEDAPSRAQRLVQSGDTIVSTVRPNRRSFMYLRSPSSDWVASTGFIVLRPHKNRINERFLYYLISDQRFTNYLVSHAHGSAYPAVNVNVFEQAEVHIPSLDIQKQIGDFLGSLDDKIELNRQMNETLKAIARALFKSWFVDFDPVRAKADGRDPGLPKEIADLFPDSFEDSELGEIPRGWTSRTLEDVCETVTRGVTPEYEKGSGRFIINQRVNRGAQLDWSALKELSSTFHVPPDRYARRWDVLVNCLGEGTIGRTHLFKGTSSVYAVDQHMSICRPKTASEGAYVHQILASPEGQEKIKNLKTGSTGMTMLNISKLRGFEILWPEGGLVNEYFNIVEPLLTRIAANDEHSRTLACLCNALLPKLISGELNIKDAERLNTEIEI